MIQYGGFVPYLYYDDAAQAIDWYTRVFGFEEIARWSGSDGRVRNAEMRAGTVNLNYPNWDTMSSFGGYKQSGNGREYADFGIHDFLETKSIVGYGD